MGRTIDIFTDPWVFAFIYQTRPVDSSWVTVFVEFVPASCLVVETAMLKKYESNLHHFPKNRGNI